MLISVYALLWGALTVFGQAPEQTVTWNIKTEYGNDGEVEVIFEGTPLEGWHTYSITDAANGNTITFEENAALTATGDITEDGNVIDENGSRVIYDSFTIRRRFRMNAETAVLKGEISWKSCKGHDCASHENKEFELKLRKPAETAAAPAAKNAGGDNAAI